MNRIVLTTTLALAMGSMASAQVIWGQSDFLSGYANDWSYSMPKEFSYNGATRLIFLDNEESTSPKASVYDENLDLVKSFDLQKSAFNYQLTYKNEEREVTSVKETEGISLGSVGDLDIFIRNLTYTEPNFTEDCLVYTPLDNGDRRIDFDYSKFTPSRSAYENWFFNEDYFGKKYPNFYYIEHEGYVTLYRVKYNVLYSDWVEKDEVVEDNSIDLEPIRLRNMNLNNNDGISENYFYVSQTLFNSDDSYEYLIPKVKMNESSFYGNETSTDYPSSSEEKIETTRKVLVTKAAYPVISGLQIVSENGNILQEINFDNFIAYSLGSEAWSFATVLTIGQNIYLVFEGKDGEGKEGTTFYKLDRTTSSLQKVRTVPGGMSLSRTIANKGADIQVNFNDGNEKGSEVSVFSANGQKVKSVMVPAGQKSATFNVNGASGMYLVNRTQKGKANDTKKIIIK